MPTAPTSGQFGLVCISSRVKFDEALTELLRAAELLPEPDAVVFEHIGDACDKLGRRAEAVLYWQKSLQLIPKARTWARSSTRPPKKSPNNRRPGRRLAHKLQRSEWRD